MLIEITACNVRYVTDLADQIGCIAKPNRRPLLSLEIEQSFVWHNVRPCRSKDCGVVV